MGDGRSVRGWVRAAWGFAAVVTAFDVGQVIRLYVALGKLP